MPRHELAEHLVFAVEASCHLWANLVDYLRGQDCHVVLVSPLAACHARPSKSGDFSRTDPKDAYLIADLAREARFHFHQVYSEEAEAMHRLAITYSKLRKSLHRHYGRLRALVEGVFPAWLKVVKPLARSPGITCSRTTSFRRISSRSISTGRPPASFASPGISMGERPS